MGPLHAHVARDRGKEGEREGLWAADLTYERCVPLHFALAQHCPTQGQAHALALAHEAPIRLLSDLTAMNRC